MICALGGGIKSRFTMQRRARCACKYCKFVASRTFFLPHFRSPPHPLVAVHCVKNIKIIAHHEHDEARFIQQSMTQAMNAPAFHFHFMNDNSSEKSTSQLLVPSPVIWSERTTRGTYYVWQFIKRCENSAFVGSFVSLADGKRPPRRRRLDFCYF